MDDDLPVWLYAIFLVAILLITAWVSSASCTKSWSRSGMETSWGPLQGCLVKLPDGRWIPADRVRETNLEG